jgi:hypothetical protein
MNNPRAEDQATPPAIAPDSAPAHAPNRDAARMKPDRARLKRELLARSPPTKALRPIDRGENLAVDVALRLTAKASSPTRNCYFTRSFSDIHSSCGGGGGQWPPRSSSQRGAAGDAPTQA